jgi:RNA polymerase sigma factor for flagellar operon FliA
MRAARRTAVRGGEGLYGARGLPDRSAWIEQYAPLVKRIALHMMARLPASVEASDVIQAGMVGLIDAVSRYEETQGAQFETYAVQRVRGAILDELRRNDWLPRSVRKNARRIESAIRSLEHRTGRPPLESEIAAHLELTLADYQRMLQEARGHQILYAEDFRDADGDVLFERGVADGREGVLDALLDEELRGRVAKAVESLPEREKLVMSLYYEKELNLREIGEVLGVTESRVCQLHTQAVARLRSRLGEL